MRGRKKNQNQSISNNGTLFGYNGNNNRVSNYMTIVFECALFWLFFLFFSFAFWFKCFITVSVTVKASNIKCNPFFMAIRFTYFRPKKWHLFALSHQMKLSGWKEKGAKCSKAGFSSKETCTGLIRNHCSISNNLETT